MNPALFITAVVAAGVIGGLVATVVLLIRSRAPRTLLPVRVARAPELLGEQPRPYIALDADAVFGLYNQTFQANIVLKTTDTRSSNLSFGADLASLNLGAERGSDGQTEIEYRPVTYAPRAMSILERQLQADGSLPSFDLKAATDDRPLANLLKNLHAGAVEIDLDVPDEVVEILSTAWKQQSRLITDATLESLGAYIRLRATFTIARRGTGEDEEFVLESRWHRGSGDVRVEVVCPSGSLQPLFPKKHDTITATCIGVPIWVGARSRLDLQLISMYLS